MRKFVINVNGNSYEVEVEEVEEGEVFASPRKAESKAKLENIKTSPKIEEKKTSLSQGQEIVEAPMPGNIWKILAEEGQEVKAGQVLLVLEAMKMENDIVSPRDGIVSSINTIEGSTVNTGDELVVLD